MGRSSSMSLLGIAVAIGLGSGCSPSPGRPPAQPLLAPVATPREPRITASVLDPGGGAAWANAIRFVPDPATLLRDCYVTELDANPDVAGWLYVDVVVQHSATGSTTKLGESSALPARLTACIADRLRAMRPPDGMLSITTVVYVSLSPRR